MSDRNARADSSGDLHEIAELRAENERLLAVVDAARAIDEWLHADMESENLGCLSCLHDNLSEALAALEGDDE